MNIEKSLEKSLTFLGFFIVSLFIAVFLLEGFSFIVLALDPNYAASYKDNKYFDVESGAAFASRFTNDTEMREFVLEFYDGNQATYDPYRSYTQKDFAGKWLTLKGNTRETINPCATEESESVWFFGGSVAAGYLARDSMTIPSLLSKNLCDRGLSVNITNYGTNGYGSTQEMITFLQELKKRDKAPSTIIFFHGVNDLYSGYQSCTVDLPQNIENRYKEFNTRDEFNLVHPIVKKTNTGKMLQRWGLIKERVVVKKCDYERLTEQIIENYLGNVRLIKALASERNIAPFFFWQPTVFDIHEDVLGDHDKKIIRETDASLRNLLFLGNKQLEKRGEKEVYTMSFDGIATFPMYTDFVHPNEYGNILIAEGIASTLTGMSGTVDLDPYLVRMPDWAKGG